MSLTNDAAYLRSVLVDSQIVMGKLRKRRVILCDIQDIRKNVDIIHSVGVDNENLPELAFSSSEV